MIVILPSKPSGNYFFEQWMQSVAKSSKFKPFDVIWYQPPLLSFMPTEVALPTD